jgi:hypothetical protein
MARLRLIPTRRVPAANKQLQRTLIPPRGRDASASLHYALLTALLDSVDAMIGPSGGDPAWPITAIRILARRSALQCPVYRCTTQ